MTFGLRNAGCTFQRYMDRVLAGLPFVFVYLDDIIIGSRSPAEHWAHLEAVFQRLHEAQLVINREKCVFGVPQLDFLGHSVSAQGTTPLASPVEAIRAHPRPTVVKELQAFLGVINFYRRFVVGAARILKPFTELLKGSPKPTSPVVWSQALESAFVSAKAALSASTCLAHPAPGAELSLHVDASDHHIRADLQQRRGPDSQWQPLGFFSKKLDAAQAKYSAFDRELLACTSGIRHFRYMLEGRNFTLFNDHKPLTYALARTSDPWTARQARQLSYIAEFNADIQHIAGQDNVVADTLSRPPAQEAGPPVPSPDRIAAGSKPDRIAAGSTADRIAAGSTPDRIAVVEAVPSVLDLAKLAEHQQSCLLTQRCLKSTALQIKPVYLEGV